MLLRHATPGRNLSAICRGGLRCSKSRGRLPVVWLHTAAKTAWAVLHTVRRHGGRAESVVILEVDVPRGWLRRNRWGLWYCPRDIPPERLKGVITFGALARSAMEDAAGR
jgi:hypothetical protein